MNDRGTPLLTPRPIPSGTLAVSFLMLVMLGALVPGCARAQSDSAQGVASPPLAPQPMTSLGADTVAREVAEPDTLADTTRAGQASAIDSVLAARPTVAAANAPHVDKTFFTRHDAFASAIALAISGAIMPFDVKIAHWTQEPHVQGDSGGSLHNAVNTLTKINEGPLFVASLATYGLGRAFHSGGVAEVGLRLSESIALTDAICELIRSPLGRARPRESQTNQYNFDFLAGFTKFQNRSFPSVHSAVAFATATTLVAEIDDRHPSALWYAAPLLYAAAAVPPLTRLYLNQHWMSDVVSGAFVGTLMGWKVVKYSHTHNPTKLDRFLLGLSAAPNASGGALVYETIKR